jgi:hypothetical protein
VYSASSSLSGWNTSTCTSWSEAHQGELEPGSAGDENTRVLRRDARPRDVPVAGTKIPRHAANSHAVDIATHVGPRGAPVECPTMRWTSVP